MPGILVVDGDPSNAVRVRRALHEKHVPTHSATTAHDCFRHLAERRIDLVVLDLELPGACGTSLLEKIRVGFPDTRVIVLSSSIDASNAVRCFRLGAVDYVTRPFALAELVARIETRLMERDLASAAAGDTASPSAIVLDATHRRVDFAGRRATLSPREFVLLSQLTSAHGAVSRETLRAQVWGVEYDRSSNVVDVYVNRLRSKLGSDVIETVRNVGYRITAA